MLLPEKQMGCDEAAVAPAHDAEAVGIHIRKCLEVVYRGGDVVKLLPAVVNQVMEGLAVSGAAAVIRSNDHVAALHRFPHKGEHGGSPVAVHAAMDPDHRGVTLGAALGERRKQVGRNL